MKNTHLLPLLVALVASVLTFDATAQSASVFAEHSPARLTYDESALWGIGAFAGNYNSGAYVSFNKASWGGGFLIEVLKDKSKPKSWVSIGGRFDYTKDQTRDDRSSWVEIRTFKEIGRVATLGVYFDLNTHQEYFGGISLGILFD